MRKIWQSAGRPSLNEVEMKIEGKGEAMLKGNSRAWRN
jgi:hypothetical protein